MHDPGTGHGYGATAIQLRPDLSESIPGQPETAKESSA